MSTNYFTKAETETAGTTGTGLDQLVDVIANDIRLNGAISQKDMDAGIDAANGLLNMIVDAMEPAGVEKDGSFTVDDIRKINAYIRENHLEEFVELHGNNPRGGETGFQNVQLDGASTHWNGHNLVDRVLDNLLTIGFEIKGDQITNEDGKINSSLEFLAETLTDFWVDRSTTNTGLDRITDRIQADKWIYRKAGDEDRWEAAEAADGMNKILLEAMEATGTSMDRVVTADEARAINAYIQANHKEAYEAFYGSDIDGAETGLQTVTGVGTRNTMFGEKMVAEAFDGLYRIGLENMGGTDEAGVQKMADTLSYFTQDQASTGTGLDQLIGVVMNDRGLARNTSAAALVEGAQAADGLNSLIAEAIQAQGLAADGVLDIEDVRAIDAYIRDNHYEEFVALHGNDEDGVETGFHLLVKNGASMINDAVKVGCNIYNGQNIVNDIMDGLYHLGFGIKGNMTQNEDGEDMHDIADVASWLNEFYLGQEVKFGQDAGHKTKLLNTDSVFFARGGNDQVVGKSGNDYIDGGTGNDALHGRVGEDTLLGGEGNDRVFGGNDNDIVFGGKGADDVRGDAGDDIILAMGDGAKDTFRGGTGADTFMIWADANVGVDKIMDFNAKEGDKIVLGGQVASFEITSAKRFDWVKMYDADGNALGNIRVQGVSAEDITVDSDAFADYADLLKQGGADIELAIEASADIALDLEALAAVEVAQADQADEAVADAAAVEIAAEVEGDLAVASTDEADASAAINLNIQF